MSQPSEMRFGSQDSRVCCICTLPVRITGERALGFYHRGKVSLAFHVDCAAPGWPHLKDAA